MIIPGDSGSNIAGRQALLTESKTDLRIGQLLIEAQILRARDLADAIKIAKLTSLPVGRILIMSSYVGEREFQAAVQAQSLVRDSILPYAAAIDALCLMSRGDLSFEDSLKELGWAAPDDATTNKLGELLLEAGIVSNEQMETAIRTCKETGLPLGRVLVSLKAITDETLTTALNAQVMVRDNEVDREQAIQGLRGAHQKQLELEIALAEGGVYRNPNRPTIKLGELLERAELVSAENIMNALENGLERKLPLGKVLMDRKLISPATLDAALILQEMVGNRTLTDTYAINVLQRFAETKTPVHEIIADLEVPDDNLQVSLRLHDLLRVSGFLQHSDIELSDIPQTAPPGSADAKSSATKLLNNGFIDDRVFFGALRCYFLIATGWLSMEQALIALNFFSNKSDLTFDDVLAKLKWTLKTRPQFASDKGHAGIVTSEGSISRLKLDDDFPKEGSS
ncbi:MAG TPA: hypothetical protein V6C76_10715 [Drouetiella sp.]